jgi:hypothetical protein
MLSDAAKALLAWTALMAMLGMVAACQATDPYDRRSGESKVAPDSPPAGSRTNRNLSGELQPPPTGDEEAVKRPPPGASQQPMPVIPPPGTPGGDPTIRPK